MRLFPYVLVRVGGGPFDKFEEQNLIESCCFVEAIAARKARLAILKEKISNAIYLIVAEQPDKKRKQFLINLKRDIFNERKISCDNLGRLFQLIPEVLQEQINDYLSLQNEIGVLWSDGKGIFEQEIREAQQKFRELTKDETLQKGLLLSSQALLKILERYLNQNVHLSRRQEHRIELSLTKYLSRMYAKTSPFSTFTNLIMGQLSQKPANDGKRCIFSFNENGEHRIISHIRLNNYLFAYLKGLLLKNPAIYRRFLLRPNPTLKKDNHYVFLTNSNNIEAFQRILANPVLEVFHRLTSEKKEGMFFQEMVQQILEDEYIEASAESLEAYIYQLTEYGFLEFNIGVSGIDPDWDIKLCEKLTPLTPSIAVIAELIEVLVSIRELANQYGKAALNERKQIIEMAYHKYRAICMKLHEAADLPAEERKTLEELQAESRYKTKEQKAQASKTKPNVEANDKAEPNGDGESHEQEKVFRNQTGTFFHFKPEQMFYEDTVLDTPLTLDEEQIVKAVSSLNELLQNMKMFDGLLDERDQMTHFFMHKYGSSASIDLLTFYEDFYREVKKPEAEKEKRKQEAAQKKNTDSETEVENKNTPIGVDQDRNELDDDLEALSIPFIKERQERNQAWLERFIGLLKNYSAVSSEEITLTRALTQQTHQATGGSNDYKETNCSYSAFVQFFIHQQQNGEEKLMAVINPSMPGYGKMLSRFLHVFDQTVTEEIRTWNYSLCQDEIFVEDCDASYFNANLHPALMPFEIWMPNGHNNLPVEQQIPVTELHVEFDTTCNTLKLIYMTTRKRVRIFDLGFQGLGRSKLFQLLEKFTAAEYLSTQPLINAVNKMSKDLTSNPSDKKNEIRIWRRPRIIYENRIILQRKAWLVPKEFLPTRGAQENDWHYFARINLWRIKLGIPDEVFVFISSRLQHQMLDDNVLKKMGRDAYKPQYISFKNYLLVKLFEQLVQKIPTTVRIEEMLPSSQQLLRIGESRYVTEFVVQWYTWAHDTANTGKNHEQC